MRRTLLLCLALLVTLGCASLGVWQLKRLTARRAANRAALAGRELPILDLTRRPTPALEANRRVRASGQLDEAHDLLLRGRLVQGVPAVQVVTPLRLPGQDTALLVNRGYVPAPDAVAPSAASWTEPGTVVFHGVLLPVPSRGDGSPLTHAGRETWKALDLAAIRARLPYPIASLYLVAEADSGSVEHTIRGRAYPFRAELPPLDEGPHLMYAVQWFGIGAAVAAFAILFLWNTPRSSTVR